MRKAGLFGSIAGLALLVFAAAPAYADDPHGFNGTVKIHEGAGESEPLTEDDPHVCTFHIQGSNFDASSTGWWTITAWPPTGDGSTVVSEGNWGPASSSGEWRTGVMTLADGHYKLSWDRTSPAAPGGEKHKVFWVECGSSETTGTTAGATTAGTTSGASTSTTSGQTTGTSASTGGETSGASGGATSAATNAGAEAATTGGNATGATGSATTGGTAAPGVAGVVNLPSTSTSRDDTTRTRLMALGVALIAGGALLLARRRGTAIR